MGMYLGGGASGGLFIPVINVGATTIARGCVVSFKTDADRTHAAAGLFPESSLDRPGAYGVAASTLVAIVPWVTSTADNPCGVTTKPIGSGEHGIILVQGLGLIRTGGSVAAADLLKVSTLGIAVTRAVPDSSSKVIGKAICDDFVPADIGDGAALTITYAWAFLDLWNFDAVGIT